MRVNYTKESIAAQLATLGYDADDIESYRIYDLVKSSFEYWEMDVDNVIGHVEDHDYKSSHTILMVQYYLCKHGRDDVFMFEDELAARLLQRAAYKYRGVV